MRRVLALVVREPSPEALVRLAEVALGYGPRVGIALGDPGVPLDTVYLDLTGCAHLYGGEEAVARALVAIAESMEHRVSVAVADGPRIARAVAFFAEKAVTLVPQGGSCRALEPLPLAALSLDDPTGAWLDCVGLHTVGDLARLPTSTLTSRLKARAKETLDLLSGRDEVPILPYEPPRVPTEETSWDEGVGSLEALLFASRGLLTRLSARLEGRGEATRALMLRARYDASVARLRGVRESEFSVEIELTSALAREADLFRVLKAKLESSTLPAPVRTLSLAATQVVRAPRVQLDLGRDVTVSPDALPTLLAELSAEIGPSSFGVFRLVATYRPEARSKLLPPSTCEERGPSLTLDEQLPLRLLPCPQPLSQPLAIGESISVGGCSFRIEDLRRTLRFDHVEWWTASPLCRDYACVWLTEESSSRNPLRAARAIRLLPEGRRPSEGGRSDLDAPLHVRAWIFRDRLTRDRFVHGFFD